MDILVFFFLLKSKIINFKSPKNKINICKSYNFNAVVLIILKIKVEQILNTIKVIAFIR